MTRKRPPLGSANRCATVEDDGLRGARPQRASARVRHGRAAAQDRRSPRERRGTTRRLGREKAVPRRAPGSEILAAAARWGESGEDKRPWCKSEAPAV